MVGERYAMCVIPAVSTANEVSRLTDADITDRVIQLLPDNSATLSMPAVSA